MRASVMGRRSSSPPSDHLVAGFMFRPWSALARHIMPSERDRRANLGARGPRCGRGHSPITGFTGPPARRRDLGGAERLVLPCNFLLLSRSPCGGDLLAETEARAVDPHPMQDDGEL